MKWEETVKGNIKKGEMTYWQDKEMPRNYWCQGTLVHE